MNNLKNIIPKIEEKNVYYSDTLVALKNLKQTIEFLANKDELGTLIELEEHVQKLRTSVFNKETA